MNIEYIKAVTYICPNCGTSIKFNVDLDCSATKELFDVVNNLICPKCKEDLSFNARTTFNSIKEYNESVKKLLSVQKECNAKLN